ncbi:heme NO-binding domain-containing protein [Pontibacter toksunensis]|uniref:Heme NO-binding domain-containing protein n=1 Tax=Pontibacter toksunensis TaxID=1332631 RepID=A0ABW6C3Z5_9BACT
MKGAIFVFLKRFVEHRHNYNTWVDILEREGLQHRTASPYQKNEAYPISELLTIMLAASQKQGIPYDVFQERFGRFLVPDLLLVFKRFVNPSWRTYQMLQHIGSHMHGGIRKENDKANPPLLHVTTVRKNVLIIDYHSRRRMAGFAIGIIKGLASYFDESDRIKVASATEPHAERVQIRVNFS